MGGHRLGTHKDVERLARKARREGITVEVRRGSHIRWTDLDTGEFLTTPLTFGDQRRIKKINKWLRQRGINV